MGAASMVAAKPSGHLFLAVLIVAYISLNSSLNLMGRYTLGHYGMTFPLVFTAVHQLANLLALAPFALPRLKLAAVRQSWKAIAYVGCFSALNIALNNISLLDVTLSLNQVIRSSIPVITSLLSVVVEGKRPSRSETFSLAVLSAGVAMCVWQGTVAGNPRGVAVCVAGALCSGFFLTFSGKVLSHKMDAVQLNFLTAPVSLACLLPFVIARELADFAAYAAANVPATAGVLLLTSAVAVAYGVVHMMMVHYTSSVGVTVVGAVKIMGLMVLSVLVLGEVNQLTFKMVGGMVVAGAGFLLYTRSKVRAMRPPSGASQPLLSK